MRENLSITPRIQAVIYKKHLPVAYGHLEVEGGKTWLGITVTEGYTKKGYGTKIVKALCDYADEGGWELWLTCPAHLRSWYKRFGFETTVDKAMRRIKEENNGNTD